MCTTYAYNHATAEAANNHHSAHASESSPPSSLCTCQAVFLGGHSFPVTSPPHICPTPASFTQTQVSVCTLTPFGSPPYL